MSDGEYIELDDSDTEGDIIIGDTSSSSADSSEGTVMVWRLLQYGIMQSKVVIPNTKDSSLSPCSH